MTAIKGVAKMQLAEEIRIKIMELNALLFKAKEENIVVEINNNSNSLMNTEIILEANIYKKNIL